MRERPISEHSRAAIDRVRSPAGKICAGLSSVRVSELFHAGALVTLSSIRFSTLESKGVPVIKVLGLLTIAAAATYGLHAFAQIRADVRPAMTPIGSSSSNGISFAWFYDSTERAVIVCRIGTAPGDVLDCKAKATLP